MIALKGDIVAFASGMAACSSLCQPKAKDGPVSP
jgi:hypothetical protein